MNVHFYLKTNKKSKIKEQPIFCYLRLNGQTKTFFINQRILERNWDSKKQRPKKGYRDEQLLNDFLNKRKAKIERMALEIQNENEDATFSQIADIIINKLKGNDIIEFFAVYDLYLEHMKTTSAPLTVKKYETLLSILKEIDSKKEKVTFDSISKSLPNWFDMFVKHCTNVRQHQSNTIRKNALFLRTFLRWANDRGHFPQLDLAKLSKVKIQQEKDKDFVALTKDEIKKMALAVLPPKLDKVRDVFLFQYYTGQRYSDIELFNENQVNKETGEWTFRQKKGDKNVIVPLLEPSIAILVKYKYKLPVITNQKANQYLKEVGELAGIDAISFSEVVMTDGTRTKTEHKKYELLCTHTARRTFATHAKYAGVDNAIIKGYTGHSSDKMLDRYHQDNKSKTKILMEEALSLN